MPDQLQEFTDSRGLALHIDRPAGVIRGIKILGLQSKNGRRYLPEALTAAIGLYEGAKVNVNHPKGSPLTPRDYQDRLGQVRNIVCRPEEGLFGDLHYNPKHALAEQLLWDAEHAPENVGLSHNIEARLTRQGPETLVEEILRVQSVDLVADPATTRGLFEGEAPRAEPALLPELSALTLEQLRAHRPDLCANLLAEQANELSRLQGLEAAERRSGMIRSLVVELKMPALESSDPAAHAIYSEAFREQLHRAAEPDLRRLLEDRARLVQTLRKPGPNGNRPAARDQQAIDELQLSCRDVRTFVSAISG